MTWEFSLIASVFLICATAIVLADKYFDSKKAPTAQVTKEEFEELRNAASVIVTDHEDIKKLVEDVKKFMSQQNIARAFGVGGRRESTNI